MNVYTRTTLVVIYLLIFLVTGCARELKVRLAPRPTTHDLEQEVAQVKQVSTPTMRTGSTSVGSLWPADDRSFFYKDRKALRIGDSLTIRIVETAQASNGADTNASRQSSINATINALLGLQGALARSNLTNLVDANAENEFAGSGLTSRQGSLTASMTAIVKDVLPNGNLVVQGSRTVLVNHEEQFMTLTGIVRPEDIGRDNLILSTQVADARIAFGGTGIVADKQRTGWGTWVADWLFPF
jgi:flagellar L-ring protein precursor FlgH